MGRLPLPSALPAPRVSGRLELPCRRLWSWAGHDAGVQEDCVAGATVLLHAIADLDARD